jgi:hypothetical protein
LVVPEIGQQVAPAPSYSGGGGLLHSRVDALQPTPAGQKSHAAFTCPRYSSRPTFPMHGAVQYFKCAYRQCL